MGLGVVKGKTAAGRLSVILTLTVALWTLTGGAAPAWGDSFPTYGTGPVQVRIYTDYFCPPCRAMEPELEPLLIRLVEGGVITVTLVDTPFSKHTALYARYFLYALDRHNAFGHALLVRNTLFEAAANRHVTTKERIEELFKGKGISFREFDTAGAFQRYNALIRDDNIDATPSCVIIRSAKKEKFVGGPDIIKALRELHR
ncbi:MAG TPA: thioredoxin domain-containing protein [Syntrophales bacterium]|nr:thioredoxin domain-containing protein [Syntrophales bacterium]HRS86607.1 thioredoxin domain-containing protein [Syntrophales bacterium]HRV42229.1 thioredoxin domain-containing protein [Syntrophales bacterium]